MSVKYILYLIPGERNSDKARKLIDPAIEPELQFQNPLELPRNKMPKWLTGVPILGDIASGAIYKGTSCLTQLKNLALKAQQEIPYDDPEEEVIPLPPPDINVDLAKQKIPPTVKPAVIGPTECDDDEMCPLPPPTVGLGGPESISVSTADLRG